jgi:hypothetical protein
MVSFAISISASLTSTSMVILTFPLILCYHLLEVVLIQEQVNLKAVMISVSSRRLDAVVGDSSVLLIVRKLPIDVHAYDIGEESFKTK